MKKILVAVLIVLGSLIPMSVASAQPKLCSMSASYRAIYEYPTGSYWQTQIAAYPSYYAAHNSTFMTKYGCQ